MAEHLPLDIPEDGKLAHNIIWFARALRAAGMPVGPSRVLDAIRAVEHAGFSHKHDFYHILQAVFVSRAEHRAVFSQIFRLFWRDPRYLEHMIAALTPAIRGVQEERRAKPAEKRAAEALLEGANQEVEQPEGGEEGDEIEIDASRTMSGEERLRSLDFEQMSNAEMAQAKRMLVHLRYAAHKHHPPFACPRRGCRAGRRWC